MNRATFIHTLQLGGLRFRCITKSSRSHASDFIPQDMLNIFSHLPDKNGYWHLVGSLNMASAFPSDATPKPDSFSYETSYLKKKQAFSIDPISLGCSPTPFIGTHALSPANGLQAFGAIRDAAPDAWGRRVIEARFNAGVNGLPEATYLLAAGGDRIGALDVRASINAPYAPSASPIDGMPQLLEIKSIIKSGSELPTEFYPLLECMSGAGGARPKAIVTDNENGQWIAKFPSENDFHDLVSAEYFAMRLARECGLNVPEIRREFTSIQPVLLVRRFDRYWRHRDEQIGTTNLHEALPKLEADEYRVPFISALTLLGCNEFDSPNMSYSQIAAAIRQYVPPGQAEKDCQELFA